MPRGGARPGAGRKPKSAAERALDGNAGHRGRVLTHPSSAGVAPAETPVEEFDAPDDLTFDERKVWMELAPFAFQNRTLTKATSLAFRTLCRNVVILNQYASSVQEKGSANHRGMIQRVDVELLSFGLAPCGKPMMTAAPAQADADPRKARYLGGSGSGA